MEGENNAAFIGHVININTAQDEFIKTEHSGIGGNVPNIHGARISELDIIVNKTEPSDETDVDNHEELTRKDQNFLPQPIIKLENDGLQNSTKTIHTDSDSAKLDRELCHYNMKDKVTPDKLHECHICTKIFTCESALVIHLRKHTGEKPYQCSSCEKKFTQKGSLIAHKRLHTGEKPYQCKTCMKCFTQPVQLSIHILNHTGEKKYKCSTCSKS